MPNSKSILLVTRPIAPPWDEASKNFAYHLAKNSTGFDLTLLTHGTLADLPARVGQKPIYTATNFNSLQKVWLFFALMRMRNDFDILHFLFTPTRQNSFFLRYAIGPTRAKTIQTVATLREDLYPDDKIKKLIFADLVVTYSDYAKEKLRALGYENVARIYPGIDLEYYRPEGKDVALLEQFHLRAEDFVVTYPGEFVRLGAMDPLVEMIITDREIWRGRNIRFLLACRVKNGADQNKKDAVRTRLEKAGCSDLVRFTDTFSAMPKIYNLSDVIIFPVKDMRGKFDVPLAAIEPMACQKPVIVSDLPILLEFAKPNHSLLIDRNDFSTLKEAILKLQDNPEMAATLGQEGRRFAQDNFDIRNVAGKYQQLYARL